MKFYKKRWIQSGIALICSLAIVLSVFPVLADNDETEGERTGGFGSTSK